MSFIASLVTPHMDGVAFSLICLGDCCENFAYLRAHLAGSTAEILKTHGAFPSQVQDCNATPGLQPS